MQNKGKGRSWGEVPVPLTSGTQHSITPESWQAIFGFRLFLYEWATERQRQY